MKVKFSLIALAALAIFGCGSKTETGTTGEASDKPVEVSNEPVTLRVSGAKGDSIQLLTKMAVEGDTSSMEKPAGMPDAQWEETKKMMSGPMKMSMEATITTVIDEIKDGNFHMTSTTTGVKASGEGMMKAQAEQMAKSEEGKVKKVVRSDRNKILEGDDMDNPFAFEYPENPVKVGDTWESDTKISGSTAKAKYKVVGMEEVLGKKCVVLEMTYEAGELTTATPAKMWIDTLNGAPVKAEGMFNMTQNGIKMKLSFTMSRV